MRPGRSALCALLLLMSSGAAQATIQCEIRKTADGFVALRDGPSATARLLERMVPGDEIRLEEGRTGKWVQVTFWRGGRFASGKHPTGDPATARGWMHESLIEPDSCG